MVNGHTWIKTARLEAWTRQKRRCAYCRRFLSRDEVTADHRVPKARGGRDSKANIKAACLMCNRAKGNQRASKFMKLIRKGNSGTFWEQLCQAVYRINQRADLACKRVRRLGGVA